ncbi:hypothetical protein PoB_006035300 [Plakobranchus ocellatus]|uniref:CUB domain-containing protein n=1 Tax=Plakobranchus ocellatus TaxID=259542 RepID=A0AAV4CPM5_9GAST|nr:hypothetical protein PoB_006035300 [Plakobranchus ocellatus]
MTKTLFHLKDAILVSVLIFVLNKLSAVEGDIVLEQKVIQLQAKQADLESRLQRQEEITQTVLKAFESVIQETTENHTNENVVTPTSALPTALPLPMSEFVVTPLQVRRDKMATGYQFTIRYVPHAQDLRIMYVFDAAMAATHYEIYSSYHELQGTPDEVDGVMKVTFEKAFLPQGQDANGYIYFTTEAERVGIKIYMGPSADDIVDTTIQMTDFSLTPPDHLVYQPGQNTEMLWVNYSSWAGVKMEAMMLDLSTGKAKNIDSLQYSFYFRTFFINRASQNADKSMAGEIQTGTYNISGYMDITAANYTARNNSAVEIIQVTKRLVLRPENQTAPFPEGFIGFPRFSWFRQGADGTRLYQCNVTGGVPCLNRMDILSVGPAQLTCVELVQNAVHIPLSVTPTNLDGFDHYLKRFVFTVQNRTAQQNSSTVLCSATNSTGFTVVQRVDIVYFVQARILRDRSSAILQNGNLTVQCNAIGFPLPNLYVYVEKRNKSYTYYDILRNQTTISSDGAEVSGELTFEQNPDRPITKAECAAVNFDTRGESFSELSFDTFTLLS